MIGIISILSMILIMIIKILSIRTFKILIIFRTTSPIISIRITTIIFVIHTIPPNHKEKGNTYLLNYKKIIHHKKRNSQFLTKRKSKFSSN